MTADHLHFVLDSLGFCPFWLQSYLFCSFHSHAAEARFSNEFPISSRPARDASSKICSRFLNNFYEMNGEAKWEKYLNNLDKAMKFTFKKI